MSARPPDPYVTSAIYALSFFVSTILASIGFGMIREHHTIAEIVGGVALIALTVGIVLLEMRWASKRGDYMK